MTVVTRSKSLRSFVQFDVKPLNHYLSAMKPTLLSLALLVSVLCTCVSAQTTADDFSDGDLLNPAWSGNLDKFTVTDGRLRLLDASQEDPAVLGLATPVVANASELSYSFLVDMDFAPSTSNFAAIELLQGGGIEDELTTGISLRIGGTSGSVDSLRATFYGDDGSEIGEISGPAGALGASPAIVRFRLIRRNAGDWTLEADYTGGTNFSLQGQLSGAAIAPDFFRLTCNYTSTRSDKFSFDDLEVISMAEADMVAPELSNATVIDERNIELLFNEPVDAAIMRAVSNYNLSASGVSVSNVAVNGGQVLLTLDADLPNGIDVDLTVLRAVDASGNEANNLQRTLRFVRVVRPSADNLRITEFMADPTPVVGLPNVEYVELFNSGDEALDLSGLMIGSGGSPVAIPATEPLPAGGYVVLTRVDEADAFRALGAQAIGFGLPTLTNGGDVITLVFGEETIQEITYTIAWYNDTERNEGGYSIEYTGGADAGCSASWRASLDASGGTPGRANSVDGLTVDNTAPGISEVDLNDSGELTLVFDENLDAAQFDPGLFSLDNGASVTGLTVVDETTVVLTTTIEAGIIYTLTVLPDFSDCAGNFPAAALTFPLAIPGVPEAGDVVINELLFNPASGGSDYLELFNCSDKVFQIRDWVLENTLSTSTTSAERTVSVSRLFLPGDYLVLTANPDFVAENYLMVDTTLLVDQTLPSLPDDEGNISVIAGGVVLDAFDYSDELHSGLLSNDDGVALERLRKTTATQDANNWFTAAQAENFGTPTRENSQARELIIDREDDDVFSVVNPTFSPDGDGDEELLELAYQTESPGFLARVRIFDAQGRLIRTLRRIELLGTDGTLNWDGSDDDGQRARAGLYVLYVELFNPNGETREEKLVAVLAL